MNNFIIEYTDGTQFQGNPLESDWVKIDASKSIKKLTYTFGNSGVILEGYSEYNHLLECVALGQKGITAILLMGRMEDKTEIIIFDLKRNQLYKKITTKYEEYGNQILNGWQKGELNNPRAYFKKI